ncbi:MAG: RDD family protein [Acidobacteriota bacterium]
MSETEFPVEPSPPGPAAAPPSEIRAAAVSPVAAAAPAASYAGFWIRVGASAVDLFLLILLWFATDAVIRISAGAPVSPFWKESSGSTLGLNCAENFVELVVWWLYTALSESSAAQATLGKRALRLRVTDTSGRRLSFARASFRNFGKILSILTLFIGFVMAGFTRRRQALHDLMAETVVLKMGPPEPASRAAVSVL